MRECPRCKSCYEDDVVVCPQDSANTKATLPGVTLLSGRYLLEKRLGRGAMGQVYLARDVNLVTRRVAVKTVRPDILTDEDLQEGEAIARFEREARAAASVRHPNVVDVTDFGKSPDGVFFLVMEYVEGETLYQLLRREGTLTLEHTVRIMRQVVAGVDAAHDEGILHRDLKPANIFIMQKRKRSGSGGADDGFVKVGDFGLAKIVSRDRSEITSASGPASRGIIGTPEYMAPEQMQPGVQLDARADIYALGTITYHIEIRPDAAEQIIQAQFKSPPSSSQLTPSHGGSLDSRGGGASSAPGVVMCTRCRSRFAAGVKFCGRCGNRTFQPVVSAPAETSMPGSTPAPLSQPVSGVTCPRCVLRYPPGTKFCGRCGIPVGGASLDWRAPRPVEVFCKNCGRSYPAGTRFCGQCGNPINA